MRRALIPGLRATFGCVGRDVLEATNARLGGAARSVFRGLYEDYKKSGRGKATT